jgi:hypothetical protein
MRSWAATDIRTQQALTQYSIFKFRAVLAVLVVVEITDLLFSSSHRMATRTSIFASALQPRRVGPGQEGRKRRQQQQQNSVNSSSSKPKPAYSVAPPRPTRPATVSEPLNSEDRVHPVQQQQLDEPLRWPELAPPPPLEPTEQEDSSQGALHGLAAAPQVRNPLRLPARSAAAAGQRSLQHGTAPAQQQHRAHRHPPIAPDDPAELLQVVLRLGLLFSFWIIYHHSQ